MNSRVLVTGAASPLGAALGRRLEQREDVEAIFGLDLVDPRAGFERLEFVHTDTRHSVLVKLIRELEIDTVIHCATRCEGREPPKISHETNVIGTMNMLGACSGAASPVRRLVVKSSVAVYGARLGLPALIGERAAGRLELSSSGTCWRWSNWSGNTPPGSATRQWHGPSWLPAEPG